MTDREIMELSKDIVMYFDGLEMCGETEDVLELMTEATYEQIKEGAGAEIIEELDGRVSDICSNILEGAEDNYATYRRYWNSWQLELTTIHDLQERLWKAVYGKD